MSASRDQDAGDLFTLFQSILDSMGDGIVVADGQGRLVLFNPAAERILGVGRTDVPPEQWSEVYGVFDPVTLAPYPADRLPLTLALRGEETNQVELRIRNPVRPSGLVISVTGRPLRDAKGGLTGGVVVVRDITERRQTEERLRYETSLLTALLDNLPDAVYFKDRASRFLCVSRSLADRFGLNHPSEAVGRSDADYFMAEHARQAALDERRVMTDGKPIVDVEETETWPDGRVTWVSTTKMRLTDPSGEVIGTFGMSRDITEKKMAQQELLKLSQALDQSADAVFITDRDGVIEYVNPAFTRMTGHARQDALGRTPHLYRPDEKEADVAEELRRLIAGGQPTRVLRSCRTRAGMGLFVDETITPLRDETGGIAHLVVTCKDVTEMRRTLDELRRSREQFALAVEGSRDGIWDWDLETNEVYFSPRWKAMLGEEDHEIPNNFDAWVDRLHPEDRTRVMNVLHAYLDNQLREYEVEMRMRHRDGSWRWILSRGTAYRDERGRACRMAGSHTDITERKKNEETLRRAMADAEAASKAKNQFLANVSHEIRTPMNGILGMTDLALGTELTAEQRDYLTMVKTSADSLLSVINDVLDFSKIEAGRIDIELEPFLLHDLIGDTVKSLALKAHGKGLELACRIGERVPDWVVGDAARLRQVLVNLIGNAVKFTERGEVVLQVDIDSERSEGAGMVVHHFRIVDTGIGIPLDKRRAIFDPFVQADGAMNRRHGGTGLGLSISSRLVELMGGRIEVESEVGCGSTFHLSLPLAEADPALPRPRSLEGGSLRGVRVLIVDDNATNRLILTEMTRGWGMSPTTAPDGPTALSLLESALDQDRPFPLLLLDAMMPDMDGFALAERIQAHPELARSAIMMLSSADRVGDAGGRRCRELGIGASLVKPLKPSELYNAVLQVLGAAAEERPTRIRPTPMPLPPPPSAVPPAVPLRILVAEDSPINQTLILNLLRKQGHDVVLVETGTAAVAAHAGSPFDVILMDISMPEMDGFEATSRIRTDQETTGRRVPIYALTAHAMKGDRERCLAHGMDGYLAKPVSAAELWQTLASVGGRRLGTDATAG